MKVVLEFRSALCGTLASAWLDFGIGSRTDVSSLRKKHYLRQVQYVEPQKDKVFRVIISIAV